VEKGYLCPGCRPGRGKGWDSNPRLARLYQLSLSPPNGLALSCLAPRTMMPRPEAGRVTTPDRPADG